MLDTSPYPHSQTGFSLITASVLLAAAALVFVAVLPGGKAGDYNLKIIDNNRKLERIDEAMRNFMAAQGRRPCPADGQYAIDTANFGVEAANPGSCQGGTPSAPLGPDSTGNLVGGAIPTKSLGLPDDYAVDAYGHRFTYIVDKRATANGSCLSLTKGGITIENTSSGGTVLTPTMYAYISHGRTGFGAWPAQGGSRINTGNTDADMIADGGFNPGWLASGELIQKARTSAFDDMVWYRPDLANTCALGLLSVLPPGSCSTSSLTAFSPSLMTNGQSLPAYASNSGAGCTSNTLTCNNGALSCSSGGSNLTDCEYSSCTATCTETVKQGGGTLNGAAPGNTATEYSTNQVTSPAACSPNTMTCANGTLSCSTGNMSDCQYASCTQVPPGCSTTGLASFSPPSMTSGQTLPAYTDGSDSTCTQNTLTCNSGTLSCSTGNMANCQYASCIKTCTETASQGGGTLNGTSPGNTATEYTSNSSSTCTANTMTCANGTLSCSTGNIANCQYASCKASVGASPPTVYVTEGNTNRVAEFDGSGNYLGQFGNGTGKGQLSAAAGMAIDAGGDLWVLDSGFSQRVEEFSSNGAYLSQFNGSYGAGSNQFAFPNGIAIDSSGNIWVADTDNNRVEEFNSSGALVKTIPSSGCQTSTVPACPASTTNGQFDYPSLLAIDSSGGIWVGNNYSVQEFSNTGAYITQFGSQGTKNGQFIYNPNYMAIDSSGNFWVVDTSDCRVEEFNSGGSYIRKFGSTGSGNGKFGCSGTANSTGPEGIAIDKSGNIWVVDDVNNRVEEFNSSGSYVNQFGSTGSGNGQLSNPDTITIDSSGNIWVGDVGNARMEEFSSAGVYENQFGFSYILNSPEGSTIDSSGNVWVVDGNNNRVLEYDSSGNYISQFGSKGAGNGQFQGPGYIAIDKSGNIWVADGGNNRVEEFSSSGTFLNGIGAGYNGVAGSIGSKGYGNGQFYGSTGIAVNSSGNIWVVDDVNNRVEEFNSGGTWLQTIPSDCADSAFPACPVSSANGNFNGPEGIAIDSSGNLWVADSQNSRVEEFNSSGTFLKGIGAGYNGVAGSIGMFGSGNGQFKWPYGVTVDSSGNVWVADTSNERVQEFNSSGGYLMQFNGGHLNGSIWSNPFNISIGR